MTIPTKSFINFFSNHLLVNSLSPFALVTWEGVGKSKIVTNDDMGGRGVKKSHFCGDVIFELPLKIVVYWESFRVLEMLLDY